MRGPLAGAKIRVGGDEATGIVIATGRHPFWVAGGVNSWINATDLRPGMWLRTSAGTYVQVTAIRHWAAHRQRVYNLTVADLHTYYVQAGDASILVHNSSCLTAVGDKFPRLAHALDEHVGISDEEAIVLAMKKSSGKNSVFIDEQLAQQVADYAVAFNQARISKWLRGSDQQLTFPGYHVLCGRIPCRSGEWVLHTIDASKGPSRRILCFNPFPKVVNVDRFTSFDFGLSYLTELFHQDWDHVGGVEEVVYSYLSTGEEPVADRSSQKNAAALACDVAALIDSSMEDGEIELLLSASTSWNHRFRGDDAGRVLLRRIDGACRRWRDVYGHVPVDFDPEWSSRVVVDEVCNVIRGTPLRLPGQVRRYFDSDVSKVRDVLDACAKSASADLAFRLLLKMHVANSVPVDGSAWIKYEEVASLLDFGEELMSSVEYLVS